MATPILSQPQTITQFDLARYIKRANQIETLKAEQAVMEQDLIFALANGATAEPGTHVAELRTTERRNVQWKAVVERLKGAGYARKVLSATKPKSYTKLIVR
jgi:uncharacterized protein (UPF0335 family)